MEKTEQTVQANQTHFQAIVKKSSISQRDVGTKP